MSTQNEHLETATPIPAEAHVDDGATSTPVLDESMDVSPNVEAEAGMDDEERLELKKLVLQWWKDNGRTRMSQCRNNSDKSNVWKNGADVVNETLNCQTTGSRVKVIFHAVKRSYKEAVAWSKKSGYNPSSFELMDECANAFESDLDVHPAEVLSSEAEQSSSSSTMPTRKARRRMTENEDRNERREYRERMLSLLERLVDKI